VPTRVAKDGAGRWWVFTSTGAAYGPFDSREAAERKRGQLAPKRRKAGSTRDAWAGLY
jgi:hypothetical protein